MHVIRNESSMQKVILSTTVIQLGVNNFSALLVGPFINQLIVHDGHHLLGLVVMRHPPPTTVTPLLNRSPFAFFLLTSTDIPMHPVDLVLLAVVVAVGAVAFST